MVQLQIVRAAAALVVVAFHAQGELHHRGFADPFPDLTAGAFGVDLFFVVSGFIMVVASERLFGHPGAARAFMARRVARIVPLYWLCTAAFALIVVRLGHVPGHAPASASHIAASFLFLPAARPEDGAFLPVCAPGWTLNYEMFFYACFASSLGLGRGRAVLAVSAGLIALVLLGRVFALPWPLFYWADPIVVEFAFGLWLGLAHRAGWRMPRRAGTVLALAALPAVALYAPHINADAAWRGLAWGVPAAALVAWALGLEGAWTGPVARAAARLGDASYSLYLVHSALFIAAFALLSGLMDPLSIHPAAYAAMLVAASAAAALASFRWFEAPVTRRLQASVEPRVGAGATSRREALPPGLRAIASRGGEGRRPPAAG